MIQLEFGRCDYLVPVVRLLLFVGSYQLILLLFERRDTFESSSGNLTEDRRTVKRLGRPEGEVEAGVAPERLELF